VALKQTHIRGQEPRCLDPQSFYQLHVGQETNQIAPRNQSESNQIQKKNQITPSNTKVVLFFSAATRRVDEKLLQMADRDRKVSAQWP